ncbi:protein [Escherichia coli]|uniref:Protein n=1 Tax=Escherichia coli TaxID=562 RepID=A0A376W5F1_ECOLX|nr:protein [Escherichia coli]
MTLLVPEVAAEVIKDLVNTVRSYDRKTNMMFVVGNYH